MSDLKLRLLKQKLNKALQAKPNNFGHEMINGNRGIRFEIKCQAGVLSVNPSLYNARPGYHTNLAVNQEEYEEAGFVYQPGTDGAPAYWQISVTPDEFAASLAEIEDERKAALLASCDPQHPHFTLWRMIEDASRW